ncbi:endonuclease/exonuclease/phosphatase family protein [Zobellella aerophila]|uniref:Endonuclease/exonuclease/phosphatase family protein n=1 Tax=Zobellella aerophila TaxID=870480 RepID=A0ABP6VQY5_9GAMM
MTKRHWLLAAAVGLSLAGCLKIPDEILLSDSHRPVAADCFYPSLTHSRPLPSEFTLLSWNIYKQQGDWQAELAPWAEDVQLLVLQEATGKASLHAWLAQRDYRWEQVAAFSWRDVPAGVMTAAQAPATQVCGQRIIEPISRIPKSQLFSRYHLEGADEQLLVVNLHGVNFSLHGRSYRDQLERIADYMTDYRGPVIVAGDFNSWNARRVAMLRQWAEAARLQEVSLQEDHRSRVFGYPLDRVYYRGLRLQQAKSMTSNASDHGPILATFSAGIE